MVSSLSRGERGFKLHASSLARGVRAGVRASNKARMMYPVKQRKNTVTKVSQLKLERKERVYCYK
jgi:hypothetical protein